MTSIGPKAYIHADRLKQNLWNIRRHIGDRKLVCVVKANGYGHGALEISKVLSKEQGIIFAVFAFEEAIELRDNGIDNDVLIFSRIHPELISKASELNFTLNVCTMVDLKVLSDFHVKTGTCPTFHLKFDTGMTRLGFDVSEAHTVFTFIINNHLNPEGIYSHFSTADEGNLSYAEIQLEQFNEIIEKGEFSNEQKHQIKRAVKSSLLNNSADPDKVFMNEKTRINKLINHALKETAQLENNLGFFANSKGSKMLDDFKAKIDTQKKQIDNWREELKKLREAYRQNA